MKKIILLVLVLASFGADAQTLKELLYSGKLKKDSTGVIRKTDDLQSKIDTTTKKEAPAVASMPAPVTPPANVPPAVTPAKDATGVTPPVTTNTETSANEAKAAATGSETVAPAAPAPAVPAKSNTKILKEYSDALVAGLKDVLGNKKIKKETYFFTVDYEINEQGAVSIGNIAVTPVNAILLDNVRARIEETPPVLAPVAGSDGNNKKVKRKFSFSVTKD